MQARNLLVYFHYLDQLSKLVNNMRDAGCYLEGRFLLEPKEAEEILDAWFTGFGNPDAELTRLLRR